MLFSCSPLRSIDAKIISCVYVLISWAETNVCMCQDVMLTDHACCLCRSVACCHNEKQLLPRFIGELMHIVDCQTLERPTYVSVFLQLCCINGLTGSVTGVHNII